MHIILSEAVALELRKKYTVLELDSMRGSAGLVPAYCVIPVEKIVMEMASLQHNVQTHEQLVDAMKNDDLEMTIQLCLLLKGKFGGELDSFYDIVHERVTVSQTTRLQQM